MKLFSEQMMTRLINGTTLALLLVSGALWYSSARAECYRISFTTSTTNTNDPYYIEPGAGETANWDGATDDSGSNGGLPSVINLNSLSFQPAGTVIGSGGDSFLNMGRQKYTPEQILFRCSPDEAAKGVWEYYATNGDSTDGGEYNDGDAEGIPETYRTLFQGLGIRVTNAITGEYYSRYWKARQLTDLDIDSQGWLLVKAKNFSGVRTELIRLNNSYDITGTGSYYLSQPAAYIAFKGGSMGSNLTVGADSLSHWDGWYAYWPGAVNLYNRLTVRRSASCMVTNVTPAVVFPPMTTGDLEQNTTRQAPIQIQFNCQTGAPANNGLSAFVSGTAANQTAMGILVPPANANSAQAEGFSTASGGITYLLSDGYGSDPSVATGVGIQISNKAGQPLTLLGALANFGTGNAAGWYPVLDNADQASDNNGVTYYNKTLTATLMKLPGKKVTPGKIQATAQVIIQVQ